MGKSGNPAKNKTNGRVTQTSGIPKPIRQATALYRARGGTLAQLRAVTLELDARTNSGNPLTSRV